MDIPFQSDFSFKYYITPEILGEINHIKKKIDGLNLLLSLKKVIIVEPSLANIAYILNKIKSLGQFGLSKPDSSILALGFQLNLPIISTDYTVINTAKFLSLDTIVPGKSNFEVKQNKKYCSICKRYFAIRFLYCNQCGNKLIFKSIKK